MPRSSRTLPLRLGATILAAVLVAVIAVAAIGNEKEPTAAEAGETLKAHVLKLFDELRARNIQVIDPGGKDIPCGDGKAKRTFAATGLDISPEQTPYILNMTMIGAMGRVADYHIADSSGATVRMVNEPTKTVILLNSTRNGQYSAQGETQCLSRS
ncbi:hypothetical protein GCM10009555_012190 [Acrocarpospora macrocephala]|uniref:Uncharacterized protein n=1 Tax=Acrocarpospora macrocephala TaxID=150177 RepID=A0A5M3WPS4_9ACTN|nr:hypothetical protein [Acrocarpospora macrocephala]GES11337.1 hypothetical protein Amac_049340 [Acrocarpospora macrocephala]